MCKCLDCAECVAKEQGQIQPIAYIDQRTLDALQDQHDRECRKNRPYRWEFAYWGNKHLDYTTTVHGHMECKTHTCAWQKTIVMQRSLLAPQQGQEEKKNDAHL